MNTQTSAPDSAAERTRESHESPFVPGTNPRISAGSIIGFIVAAALVFGGFYMMGMAFSVPGAEIWLFGGGIMVDALGLWIAFGLIPALEDRRG